MPYIHTTQMAAMPSTLYYTIFELPIGTLYFSTLLANLNARRYVLGSDGGILTTSSIAYTHTDRGWTSPRSLGGGSGTAEGVVVMVPMETGRKDGGELSMDREGRGGPVCVYVSAFGY